MRTNEIDKLITQALSKEEAEFYNQLEEQSMPEMVGGLFRGKLKWLNVMILVGMLIVFGLAVFCTIQFLSSTDQLEAIKWGAGVMFFMMATGFIKMMQFMQMENNVLLREIKRLELQMAVLAGKMS